jgi:hypothetical protein
MQLVPLRCGDAAIELGADPLAFISKAQLEHGDVVGRGKLHLTFMSPNLVIFVYSSLERCHH